MLRVQVPTSSVKQRLFALPLENRLNLLQHGNSLQKQVIENNNIIAMKLDIISEKDCRDDY